MGIEVGGWGGGNREREGSGGEEGVKERPKEMHKHAEFSGRMYLLKMMLHAEHMLSMQLAKMQFKKHGNCVVCRVLHTNC